MPINLLYEVPSSLSVAPILTCHKRRISFFLSRRCAKAYFPACAMASRAADSFLLRPKRYPFTFFKMLRRRFIDIVPLLTLGMFYELAKNRARAFRFMTNGTSFLPLNCFVLFCLALKWLNPGFRPRIFPFLVTRSLLLNDLFVFIYFLNK